MAEKEQHLSNSAIIARHLTYSLSVAKISIASVAIMDRPIPYILGVLPIVTLGLLWWTLWRNGIMDEKTKEMVEKEVKKV